MEINVKDKYRTNQLSLTPGGSVVKVQMKNGNILVYDKVKSPIAYISNLTTRDEIVEVWVNDTPLSNWKSDMIERLRRR